MIPDFVEEVGRYWVLKNDNGITPHAKAAGDIAYDRVFLDLPELERLPKRSLVVDVGAFIGDTTRIFLNKGFGVLAFEPQPDAFECLKHNCPDAELFPAALGDGRAVSLHPGKGGNMGAREVQEGGDILTFCLDELLPYAVRDEVTFLKLDAEGFEPAILAGAKKLLASPRLQYVVCEFNPVALGRFGWGCEGILKHLPGWKWREIFRYGEENWDCLFYRE